MGVNVMSNFLRKIRRFHCVGAVAIVASGSARVHSKSSNIVHSSILKLPSYTTNPVPSSHISSLASAAAAASGPFGRDTIANAAAKVGPALVHFEVKECTSPWDLLRISAPETHIGSGTIIDKDGTILTCAHLVGGPSQHKIEVTMQDGRTFEGKVVNADTESDIAIVKVNSETPLPEAKLGSSSRLRTGDWVIAMGSPYFLQNTVTAGIISCVNRKSHDLGMSGTPREYLQADCTTSGGNFGGPLVNMDGEVVGVDKFKVEGLDGFSFSVPIDSVDKIIEHLKKSGDTIANAAAKVGPALVHVDVKLRTSPWDLLRISAPRTHSGSGTIIDKDGTILTSAHVVVGPSKDKIKVTMQDGRTFEGKVVYADTELDIAIVKVNSETPLPEAKLGSSSRLRTGDWVIAMGSPRSLRNSVTAGIISCVNRKSHDLGMSGTPREYLQADCTTSGGNSGGPLVNMDGEVVGVNSIKVVGADGCCFSVPIDSVDKIIEHLKKSGRT